MAIILQLTKHAYHGVCKSSGLCIYRIKSWSGVKVCMVGPVVRPTFSKITKPYVFLAAKALKWANSVCWRNSPRRTIVLLKAEAKSALRVMLSNYVGAICVSKQNLLIWGPQRPGKLMFSRFLRMWDVPRVQPCRPWRQSNLLLNLLGAPWLLAIGLRYVIPRTMFVWGAMFHDCHGFVLFFPGYFQRSAVRSGEMISRNSLPLFRIVIL